MKDIINNNPNITPNPVYISNAETSNPFSTPNVKSQEPVSLSNEETLNPTYTSSSKEHNPASISSTDTPNPTLKPQVKTESVSILTEETLSILPSPNTPIDNEPNKRPEMITIKYTDYYGVVHDIEVTKEFADKYYAMIKDEKRIERKETRRHISLETLSQKGIEFSSTNPDPLDNLIQKEQIQEARKLIASLRPSQQKLIKQLFYENLSFSEIAHLENVTPSAIRHRWGRIKKFLK